MTFYSELVKTILHDEIGGMGFDRGLVNEMIDEIIDLSFDFKDGNGMHAYIKAVCKKCENITSAGDDEYSGASSSGTTWETWTAWEGVIVRYLSDNDLFKYVEFTLEEYLTYETPVQVNMITIIYRDVANRINDFLWEKFFE